MSHPVTPGVQDSGTDTALLAAIDKHMIASLAALAFSHDMVCLDSYDACRTAAPTPRCWRRSTST